MFGSDYASLLIFKQQDEELKKVAEQHRVINEKPEEPRRRRITRINNN